MLTAKRGRVQSYLDTLKRKELIAEFDEVLWYGTVEQVRVAQDGKLRVIFKDAGEFEELFENGQLGCVQHFL